MTEKNDLNKKLEDYSNQIRRLETQHEIEIIELEKNNLIEKNNLKKEMTNKLNQLAKEFRNLFHQNMSKITKKAIHENDLFRINVQKLTIQVDQLLNENQLLKESVNIEKI